ncbi:MAG: RluA family pseudouridine synthase, partial [Spirochaetaceae bacterium]|nr:RluA family pseudouridine synthase [Spirochaetaceae bacterium]
IRNPADREGPLPDLLWEGAGLLIVNKPPGLAVHGGGPAVQGSPAAKSGKRDTLEHRVRRYLTGRLPPSLSFTPGPLHRLDKPTSGIVVFSTTLNGARHFSALLREGKIHKRYLAILEGNLTNAAVWEEDLYRSRGEQKTRIAEPSKESSRNRERPPGPDRGRRALTRVSPIARTGKGGVFYTLAEIGIETGRTHQIRVQAAYHGHPLAGDRKYGGGAFPGRSGPGGFFLHAGELEIPEDPADPAGESRLFRAPPPEAFSKAVRELFGF